MQARIAPPRLALDQRAAQLEQLLRRTAVVLGKVPIERWKFLVTLILVVWLSYSLACLFWLFAPAPDIPTASVSSVVSSAGRGANSGQAIDIQALKEAHIFGEADEAAIAEENVSVAPVANNVENEAVDTQLNLILRGVVGSNLETGGRAIIANGSEQNIYAPGDELPAGRGVTLAKVLDTRVILNNNGRYESLWLYQEGSSGRSTISSSVTPVEQNSRSRPDDEPEPQAELFADPAPAYDTPTQGGEDPASEAARTLSDVVAMSIHREGGQVVGYRIRPGRNAEQFTALGLQTDDIVTAVNGVPLTSPGKVMEIYKNMSNATSASLEIKRGGSVMSIDIVLE